MTKPHSEHHIVVLGVPGVGKTTLTCRIIEGRPIDEYDPSLINSFRKWGVLDGEDYLLELLDIGPKEQFDAIRELYSRTGHAFLIVYDVTSRETFDVVRNLWEETKKVKEKNGMKMFGCVVGNKIDLMAQRAVFTDEGMELAEELGCLFQECSGKTGENADAGVFELIRLLRQEAKREEELLEEEIQREETEKAQVEKKKKHGLWKKLFSR